ncbi:MAG: hypothetical protein HY951_18155 [Bacteroidia bacterium]|nr:hypothetical protein [Bacteroidia bacterium]
MHIYLLIHTINSPTSKRKLENYLPSLTNILSFEVENNCCTYEIQTNIRKKELIKLLGFFVKKLSLNIDERVVLYDTNILSSLLEKPSNNEKIILNGDVEKENRIEDIIIEMFKYINFRQVLEEVHKNYFDSLPEKHNTQ